MPRPEKPIATDVEPPKKTTPAVKAAQLFNKLEQLDQQEKDELANAPASIRERFDYKRLKLREGVSPDVLALLDRMRGEP